jgi:hypothetical protein
MEFSMPRLVNYIAGGAVFLLALDWAGVSFGTYIDAARTTGVDALPAHTIVAREGKGDRLDVAATRTVQTTIVRKSARLDVAGPQVPSSGSTASVSLDTRQAPKVRDSHIPDGCDGAFSPLASVKNNFTARCVS